MLRPTRKTCPITPLLRKGQQSIGPFLSKFMSYEVEKENLSAQIGIIERGRRPVNRRIAVLAYKQAAGYKIPITRAAQRRLHRRYHVSSGERQDEAPGAWVASCLPGYPSSGCIEAGHALSYQSCTTGRKPTWSTTSGATSPLRWRSCALVLLTTLPLPVVHD